MLAAFPTKQLLKVITKKAVDGNSSSISLFLDLIVTVTVGTSTSRTIIDEAGEIIAEETEEGETNEAYLAIWFRN